MAEEGGARVIRARAPTRIDLGGGWTDVPPYCEREGGFVCNLAIDRYAVATLTPQVAPRPSRDRPSHVAPRSTDLLVRAALRRAGSTDLDVSISSDFPVGAGLGGSSAASAALLGALAAWRNEPLDRGAIAEEGRRIEVEEMGIAGGRQDHYAAAFGGALALTFSDTVHVRPLLLSSATKAAIESCAILIYTNESRISGSTITAVLDAYQAGEKRVVKALSRMRSLAEEMSVALERGDIDHVGALLDEHWTHQRSLHPTIPTPLIDEIVATASRNGALGAKAMGASGGGCVLVIAKSGEGARVREAIAPFGALLPFKLDASGVTVV